MTRTRWLGVPAAFLTALLPLLAQAQGYPHKTVKIIAPVQPGGGVDLVARTMADRYTKVFGQTFIVENQSGGGGSIASQATARAAPDGYTLMIGYVGTHGTNPAVRKVPYDAVNDFTPIAMVGGTPNVLVVHPSVPAANLSELVEYAKKNPGKLTFGSSGTGAASHLCAELFKSMAGIDMLHVPYKGTGQAVTDLVGGQIDVMFAPAQAVMPHVQGGKLKALAVTTAKRSPALPNLPTVAETGVPGYEAVGWFGWFAPVATPKDRVARISADANKVLADPEVREKMLSMGAEPTGDTPEQFATFVREDQAKWSKLMKERGISPE
jgi:tripartite-type tricarboxylate transporter receptor subunit TctC